MDFEWLWITSIIFTSFSKTKNHFKKRRKQSLKVSESERKLILVCRMITAELMFVYVNVQISCFQNLAHTSIKKTIFTENFLISCEITVCQTLENVQNGAWWLYNQVQMRWRLLMRQMFFGCPLDARDSCFCFFCPSKLKKDID